MCTEACIKNLGMYFWDFREIKSFELLCFIFYKLLFIEMQET